MKLVRKVGLVKAIREMSGSGSFLKITPFVYNAAGIRFVLRKRRKARRSGPSLGFSRLAIMMGVMLFALGFYSGKPSYGASGTETKRVLILYSFDKDEDFFYQFDRTLRSKLQSESPGRIEFYTEFLDLVRFPSERHEELLDKLLKLKLSELKPDLIIPVSYPALNFLLGIGKDLFPKTPIVFSCVGDSFADELKNSIARAGRHNVGGVLLRNQQGDSLKLAFQLQPDTQRVVAVAGATPLEKYWVTELEKELAQIRPGIKFTYLSNLPMDDILKNVAVLPPHTIIFYPYFFMDSTGRFFAPEEALDLISGAADMPVYGSFRSYIGHGLVGGQMLDYADVAVITAEDASRALRGEQAADPQFVVETKSNTTVDWRELQRWNISESRVPPGTIVLFKETSLLERYRWYILGIVTLCVCEAILILTLLVQGARRKQAEGALRESEERLRLAVQAGKMYAFDWDMGSDVIVRTGQCGDILNWMDDATHDTGQQFIGRVHSDDRESYAARETGFTPDHPAYQTTYRMVRPDGGVVWLEESGHAFFDRQGRLLRIIGMVTDVTDRKRAEEALSSVSLRLIEAQEQERTRIARELHDDVGQRLALLTIELDQLRQVSPDFSVEVCSRIAALQNLTTEIASDVQSLSHELHSSKLEYLGIATAMSAFCKEFSDQQAVEVVFAHDEVPRTLPPEISLCLFRVLQEALRNALKHSGVRQFDVELYYSSDEIHLTVSDSGSGFESKAAKESRGLGLISMEERVKLLNGTFSIESRPECGTTIHAHVPLSKVARAGL